MLNGVIEDSDVTVASGGTLAGTGEVENVVAVQSGGTLSPGTGIGILTIDILKLASGSLMAVDVDATSASSDRVTGLSSANYSGHLVLNSLSGSLKAGQSFQIFDARGSGAFTTITPAPGPGLGWGVSLKE